VLLSGADSNKVVGKAEAPGEQTDDWNASRVSRTSAVADDVVVFWKE